MDIAKLQDAARQGDAKAEEQLFSLLSERFHHFTHRRVWSHEDAEEVVQEALAAIARDYKSVDFTESFAAWAYKVLDNRILHYIRTKRSENAKSDRLAAEHSNNPQAVPDPTLKTRLLDCLKKVGEANLRYARILNLHYHGFKTEEVCDRLDIKPNNLYVVLARARAMLRKCIEEGAVR